MSRRRALSLLAPLLLLAACSERTPPRAAARHSLLDSPAQVSAAYVSPARWQYHPLRAGALHAKLSLPDGGVLYAGERGERWLTAKDAERSEVSAELAPEELRAAVRLEGGGFLFVGRSGTTYESTTPLGAFVRSTAPLEPFARVRAAGTALLGIRRDGALFASDSGGAAWKAIGPSGVSFEDALIRPDGRGLALAVPEALYETRDAGANWARVATKTFGAESLVLDEQAGLVVLSAFGPRRWEPAASPPFVDVVGNFSPRTFSMPGPPPLGPSALALSEGRAFVQGSRFTEARVGPETGTFQIVEGELGSPLTRRPLSVAKGCERVWLSGMDSVLYLACIREKSPTVTQAIDLRRSSDRGKTWAFEPYVAEGRADELGLAVGKDGALLLTGICPPAARGPGCRPTGILRRHLGEGDGGPKIGLEPAVTPSLAGSALRLGFSVDGITAFAIGRRSKGEALAAFISKDGGATFEAREVEALGAAPSDGRTSGRGQEAVTIEAMAPSETGMLGVVLARRERRSWLVLDDEGRTVALAEPPAETARLGVAGERAFAFDPSSRDAWESLDGGAGWTPLGKLAVDPCPSSMNCRVPITCFQAGCALGELVSRLGWQEQPRRTLLAPRGTSESSRRAVPRVGAPLTCTLDKGEWRRVPGATEVPSASASGFGKVAWFAPRMDPKTGLVSVFHMKAGPRGALEEIHLFDAAPRPEAVAVTATAQVEGVAALRFALPTKADTRRRIEVAWDDLVAGRVGKAVIADLSPYRPGDSAGGPPGAVERAAVNLLSIAEGGVYVRAHAAGGDDQPTYFLDGNAVDVLPPVAWPKPFERRGRSEVVHVGQGHVALHLDGHLVARATRSGQSYEFDAARIGWAAPDTMGRAQSIGLAYSGGRAGLRIQIADSDGQAATALLYPFRSTGAVFDVPLAVPTQLDLASVPRACSPADRSSTPRIVAGFLSGTRHPILVSDPVEPMRVFLTEEAVLHGTPQSPCAVTYDATLVSLDSLAPGEGQREAALVQVENPERSFIFRSLQEAEVPGLQYRTMSCRFDPAVEVPIEVFAEKATLVSPR